MPKFVLLEEFHLDFFVPPELRPAEIRAIRRALAQGRFGANLRRAIRNLLQRYPSLRKVRVTLTR